MITIGEIAKQTRLLFERCQNLNGERERMTTTMEALETRIESLRESKNLLLPALMDSPTNCETRRNSSENRTPQSSTKSRQTRCRRRCSWVRNEHGTSAQIVSRAASLTDNGLEIFQMAGNQGSEKKIVSLARDKY